MPLVNVTKLTPTPLNCAAQFSMVLASPSNVVNFYLTNSDASIKLKFDYPHARVEKTGELTYVFTAPRIKEHGIWRLEWLTDFGSSNDRGILFRVNPVVSTLLAEDIAGWADASSESSAPGTLPSSLPMTI